MIIVELMGGAANQLFQYAHARFLSLKLKQELKFDFSFFDRYHRSADKQNTHIVYKLDKFNTNIKTASDDEINRIKRKLKEPRIYRGIMKKLGFSTYCNTKYHFDNERIDNCDIKTLKHYNDLYISGYYGDEKYFIDIEDIIRTEFTLKEPLNNQNKNILKEIEQANSVSLHVRKGDYVNNNFFTEIPLDYYRKAVDYIESRFPNTTCFVFSDDLNWVKDNIELNSKTIFVNVNDEKTDYMELMLMTSCKHNIIANSTFSWWGAWLNRNPEKIVIAPKVWYGNTEAQAKYDNGNLVPSSWKKM